MRRRSILPASVVHLQLLLMIMALEVCSKLHALIFNTQTQNRHILLELALILNSYFLGIPYQMERPYVETETVRPLVCDLGSTSKRFVEVLSESVSELYEKSITREFCENPFRNIHTSLYLRKGISDRTFHISSPFFAKCDVDDLHIMTLSNCEFR
jgi:hypothetical protein